MRYGTRVHTFGIRLHPARAAAFLGIPATRLANTLTPLGRLAPSCDARVVEWLRGNPQADSAGDRAELEGLLMDHCRQSRTSDQTVVRAVDQLLAAHKPVTVVHLARELRMTPRHLYRKFVISVGTAPKRLERLARFARTWQAATMGPTLGWAELAYAHGYADQAHLVREFRAFGATPPTHLFTPEWYEATTIRRVSTAQHEEVRSVQSSRELPDPRLTHQPRTATAGRKRSRSI
jgi:AraC-like DNA-binding protein